MRIAGETPQTAPLVKILDASPFFEKTEIQMSAPRANGESVPDSHHAPEGQMNLRHAGSEDCDPVARSGVARDPDAAFRGAGGPVAGSGDGVGIRADGGEAAGAAAPDRGDGARQRSRDEAGRGELESREKGMLKAETSAQAQAQLQEHAAPGGRSSTESTYAAWKMRA